MKIAIIPARGGSKRIPRKNIKPFLGKPIIAYTIETAIKSQLFDEVMVSTDDEEIALIARSYGAKVPVLRSKDTSTDFATTFEVIQEVLSNYDSTFEYACCIYPCNPFLTEQCLINAFELLVNDHKNAVFPIIAYSHPIQRAFQVKENSVVFTHPEFALTRTQDLPQRYYDAGQFYFFRVAPILASKQLIDTNSGGIIISEMEAQDIDNETDWKLAELKYQLMTSQNS